MRDRKSLLSLCGLLLICSGVFYYELGGIGLFDVDEAVFAQATREMVEGGDWITPHYNQENRYDKPIFIYWLMGISYQLFGISEFSARLVSATLATGLACMLIAFLGLFSQSVTRRPSTFHASRFLSLPLFTALIFILSPEVMLLGRAAITDVTLTFFITLSLLSFFAAYRSPVGIAKTVWYGVFYAAMGFAVLTKGPVGIVLPGGIIIFFLLTVGRFREVLREARILLGVKIFAVIALPWYVLELEANGWEFFNAFFVKHNLTRYTGVNSGHNGSVLYFIPVILLGFFPWSAFVPSALGRVLKPAVWKSFREQPRADHLPLFAALWFLVVFVFFSLSGTKLPGYILPLFPAMAILVGWWWQEHGGPSRGGVLTLGVAGFLLSGLLVSAPALLARIRMPDTMDRSALPGLESALILLGTLLFIGMVVFVLAWRRWGGSAGATASLVLMGVFLFVVVDRILPAADGLLQAPLREIAIEAGEHIRSEEGRLVVYGMNKPSILFYSRNFVTVITRKDDFRVADLSLNGQPVYLITTRKKLDQLPPMTLLTERGGYILARLPKGTT